MNRVQSWITPANPDQYDTYGAFNKLAEIDWKQSTNVEKGAIVYIYQSKQFKCITHKCLVVDVDKKTSDIDDSEFVIDGTNYIGYGRFMTLRLLAEFKPGEISLDKLRDNGLTSRMQGPCKAPDSLVGYIESFLPRIVAVNPETNKRYLDEDDIEEDKNEVEAILNSLNETEDYESNKMPTPVVKNGVTSWPRDSRLKAIALKKSGFKCEVDGQHGSFVRKSNGLNYTEGHHLIPLQAQGDPRFKDKVNLDCVENIVSLCSNCHNMLHYGKDFCDALRVLYDSRKDMLEKKGIFITFDELVEYYK